MKVTIPFFFGGGGGGEEKGVSEAVEILGQASYSVTSPSFWIRPCSYLL